MLDWYSDFAEEGKGRFIITFIASALLIVLFAAIALVPTSAYEGVVAGDELRAEKLAEYKSAYYVPILTVIGSFLIFIGLDLMRDEFYGAKNVFRILLAIVGACLILFPSMYNAMHSSCYDGSCYENLGNTYADMFSVSLRALTRTGLFGGVIAGSFFAYCGISDDFGIPNLLAPIMPILAYIVSFVLNLGCSYVSVMWGVG